MLRQDIRASMGELPLIVRMKVQKIITKYEVTKNDYRSIERRRKHRESLEEI